MNLLDKFNSVEITADTRINDADRAFCQVQKEAYDHARQALKFMAEQGQKYLDEQTAILKQNEKDVYSTYLGDFHPHEFTDSLRKSHSVFISRIFHHFQNKYNVTIDASEANDVLLPKKPEYNYHRDNKEELEAYSKAMSELSLDYQIVLDQIFIQLGGFSFRDKAIHELKEKAHDAAWNKYRGTKDFEQKKAVISFTSYACSFDSWHEQYHKGEHEISLCDGAKNVIRALIFFEYDSMDVGYTALNTLLGYQWITCETELSVNLEKVKSVKCFKNGRMDIRFQNEAFAREFADEFLNAGV